MFIFQKVIVLVYLILISFSDFKFFKIPNKLLSGLFITVSCFNLFKVEQLLFYVFSLLVFFIIFFIIYFFSKGLGFGDVRLISLIAYCFGFWDTCLITLSACLLGLLYYLVRFMKKVDVSFIPFAPFLTVGTLLVYLKEVI